MGVSSFCEMVYELALRSGSSPWWVPEILPSHELELGLLFFAAIAAEMGPRKGS